MKFNQIQEPYSSPVEMLRRQSTVKGELKTVLMILAFPPCMILVFWEGLYAGGFPSEQTLVVLEVVRFPYVIAKKVLGESYKCKKNFFKSTL